jgi:hypothetical protein
LFNDFIGKELTQGSTCGATIFYIFLPSNLSLAIFRWTIFAKNGMSPCPSGSAGSNQLRGWSFSSIWLDHFPILETFIYLVKL